MDIYEALVKDHDKVKQLLSDLVMAPEGGTQHKALIEQIRDELIPHARAEESVFYNSLRTIPSTKDLVMHSFTEHVEAETILRTLQIKDKIDADWRKTAENLKKALDHHIAEEEGKIFDAAKVVFTDEEARMMGEAFEKLKGEVQKEGFAKTTLDLIINLMPPRFIPALKSYKPPETTARH